MKRVPMLLFVFAAGAILGHLLTPVSPPKGDAVEPVQRADEEPPPIAPARSEDLAPTETARLEGSGKSKASESARPPRVAQDGRVETRVLVFLPDGTMPPEATVYWTDDPEDPMRSRSRVRWKPPHTAPYIQPGDQFILATAGVRESLKSETARIHISPRGGLQEVRLVVEDRAGIHGRVVLPAVFDRPRIKVHLCRREANTLPGDHTFGRDDAAEHPEAREGYGFAFHDLDPGDYVLGLSLGHDRIVLTEAVHVERSMVEQDLVIEAFDPKHYMEVRVLGPDGRPLEGTQVSICFDGKGEAFAGGNAELRRADGTCVVDHNLRATLGEDGKLKEGRYTVHVRTRNYGEIVQPYDPRTTTSLTIRARERGSLVIEVMGLDPDTAPGSLAVAARQVGERGVRNPKLIGPDGKVDFGECSPGSYEILFIAGTRPGTRGLRAIREVEFAGDENVTEVPAPVFHQLVLRLPESAVDPVFCLSRRFRVSEWSLSPTQDDSGNLVFEHLTEGTYSLEGHVGERWIKREIHLPAETEIRLD